jgi:hypothetical protein
MTEPILKLDLKPEEPEPPKRGGALRWTLLGIALAALFAGVAMAVLVALPRPHTQADYMIAGGLATMITMLALFAAVLSTQTRVPDPFYKRRHK